MSGLDYGMPTCIGTANGSWLPSTCSSRQRQLLRIFGLCEQVEFLYQQQEWRPAPAVQLLLLFLDVQQVRRHLKVPTASRHRRRLALPKTAEQFELFCKFQTFPDLPWDSNHSAGCPVVSSRGADISSQGRSHRDTANDSLLSARCLQWKRRQNVADMACGSLLGLVPFCSTCH